MKPATSARPLSVALALVLVGAAIAGCAAKQSSTGEVGGVLPQYAGSGRSSGAPPEATNELAADKSVQVAPSAPASEGTTGEVDRMIIRSNTLRLEVESTPDAVSKIRELATKNNAVITDLQVATDTDDWLYRYD